MSDCSATALSGAVLGRNRVKTNSVPEPLGRARVKTADGVPFTAVKWKSTVPRSALIAGVRRSGPRADSSSQPSPSRTTDFAKPGAYRSMVAGSETTATTAAGGASILTVLVTARFNMTAA
jgi:hypothetical protein